MIFSFFENHKEIDDLQKNLNNSRRKDDDAHIAVHGEEGEIQLGEVAVAQQPVFVEKEQKKTYGVKPTLFIV